MLAPAATARAALHAPETDEVFLVLLTIDHTDMAAPIRVCNNTVDVTSREDVWNALRQFFQEQVARAEAA